MNTVPRPPKDHFNVLFFASAGSFTCTPHEAIPGPLSLKKLFEVLEERYIGIKERILDSSLVTVNLEYVDIPGPDDGDGPIIQAGDEVAIIPPWGLGSSKSTVQIPRVAEGAADRTTVDHEPDRVPSCRAS
ncbi:Molybdopterin synthase sulfur carrier subunit [Colletotrichum higginsianum IMI 349063]|uniref:Molybdopterin synthase sulfur carrier subunit n=1 Tax=Colletotrichum higginsianum (strain IMI 349063) TaxID=759273 RepID=A0A1B7YT98_COLHI|nr:Molybdopterin synthase sulfur carrier subunit [Colletotrichum higginsianum IMI 349063]OBR15275.1 Molybdopterin synthase sulfur carrier subunit [Colletotrichum higginsianum IMI 349063]